MFTLIELKQETQSQETKSFENHSQKAFDRFKKKIEILQLELQSIQKKLDKHLGFYHEFIEPKQRELKDTLIKVVKILYEHYQNSHLSKRELSTLKELISHKIAEIFELAGPYNIDPEIISILKDIEGVDYDELMAAGLNKLKNEMEEIFNEMGAEVDLSHIDSSDDEETIMRKIDEAMCEARSQVEEESSAKSQKELELELKKQKLEALQKQSLSNIYKQLAKILHPDLEQNIELKSEKEKLMKRLTSAYENKDLHALLLLEMEWANRSDKQSKDQLKVYNSLLRKQVKALQSEIKTSVLNPKYFQIHKYLMDTNDPSSFNLNLVHSEIKNDLKYFQHFLSELKGHNPIKMIRNILRSCS